MKQKMKNEMYEEEEIREIWSRFEQNKNITHKHTHSLLSLFTGLIRLVLLMDEVWLQADQENRCDCYMKMREEGVNLHVCSEKRKSVCDLGLDRMDMDLTFFLLHSISRSHASHQTFSEKNANLRPLKSLKF